MRYRVHQFDIKMKDGRQPLEDFLNSLGGDVVAIVANNRRTTLAQIFGATDKIDFLLIIEKLR